MIAIITVLACSTVCKGPGCEDDWPASKLAIHRGGSEVEGTLDAWDNAGALFEGSDSQGASWSVEGLNQQLVIGQPEDDAVVVIDYISGPGSVTATAGWVATDTRFGAAIAVDRHIRDDGWDLWVGGPDWNLGTGAVWFFNQAQLNHSVGLDASTATLRLNGGSPGDRFGSSIAICGDMTGDGLPEIAITSPWFDAIERIIPAESLGGAVFLLYSERLNGASTGDDPWDLGSVWWGTTPGEGAGHAIVCDDDLTGDGIADLAIGAPWYKKGVGRVYIVEGGELAPNSHLEEAAARLLEAPNQAEHWLGMSLVALDLIGDRAADLAVGAPGFSGGKGSVLIYRGASIINAYNPEPYREIRAEEGREEADHMGRWLAFGRIYDGDQDDLVVGAPDYHGDSSNSFDTGHAWIWRGDDADTWSELNYAQDATAEIGGTTPFQRIGRRPAVYDVDDDGLGDLLLVTRSDSNE